MAGRTPKLAKISISRLLAEAALGFLLGCVFLHPVSMTIIKFLTHSCIHDPNEIERHPILHTITCAFQVEMIPMATLFGLVGASILSVTGYHRSLILRQKNFLAEKNADLAKANKELEETSKEIKILNTKLAILSRQDGLTGLSNRRSFNEYIDKEWRRARRNAFKVSLIMIDIDYFKNYNDRFGHLAGDVCLQRVGKALASCARRGDDFVARYGGEEFVVVLGARNLQNAAVVGEQMRQAVEDLALSHPTSKAEKHVTISLGIASLYPHDNLSFEDLIKVADEALYRAKENGRNQLELQESAEGTV